MKNLLKIIIFMIPFSAIYLHSEDTAQLRRISKDSVGIKNYESERSPGLDTIVLVNDTEQEVAVLFKQITESKKGKHVAIKQQVDALFYIQPQATHYLNVAVVHKNNDEQHAESSLSVEFLKSREAQRIVFAPRIYDGFIKNAGQIRQVTVLLSAVLTQQNSV